MTDALLTPGSAMRPRRRAQAAPHVTAVVVTRGPSEFLPETLAGLAAQILAPAEIVVVDVDADDEGAVRTLVEPLWSAGPPDPSRVEVLVHPGARTFGAAVRAGLAAADAARTRDPGPSWVWLLHDDSAPEPDALSELVRSVELAPSVGIAGVKQRTWSDEVRVVEVGVTTSRFGRRMTGLDEPELDQGQHDSREDVLAVGLAGALVRRDVWDLLGGPDPALGPYGDGLDLCRRARLAGHRVVVVPRAVVRHAQASLARPWSGAVLNRAGWDARRSAQARREAYLHSQLTGVPLGLVPVVAVLALASSPVRALGRLVTKEPHLVVSELLAPWAVLLRPARLVRSRRLAARSRRLPRRSLRPLQVSWRDVARQARDRRLAAAEVRRRTDAPSELEQRELTDVRTRRRAGLTVAALVALGVALVALGPLLTEVTAGGRIVVPGVVGGSTDVVALWQSWTADRVPAGLGRAGPTDPFLAALLPFTALTGSLDGTVALLLLGAPLLGAVGAWFAAGAATRSVLLRLWAALVWVAVPASLTSVGQGRLGAVLAHLALPWVVLGVARGLGVARRDVVVSGLVGAQRLEPVRAAGSDVVEVETTAAASAAVSAADAPDAAEVTHESAAEPVPVQATAVTSGPADPSYAATAGAGLALALVTAGAPVLLPAALLGLAAVAVVSARRARLLWVAAPSLVLHAPVLVEAARLAGAASDPTGAVRLLMADPGAPVAVAQMPGWLQALGWADQDLHGALGLPFPPWVLTVPLVAIALLALTRRRPHRVTRLGWVLAGLGVVAAVVATRVAVGLTEGGPGAPVISAAWSGPGASLATLGFLVAALPAADGMRRRLDSRAFGWRQATAATLALVAVVGPAAVLVAWTWQVRPGSTADVARPSVTDVPVVPAAGRQMQGLPEAPRVLSLTLGDDGAVTALLLRAEPALVDGSRATTTSVLQAPTTAPEPGDDEAGPLEALLRTEIRPRDAAAEAFADAAARLATGTGVATDLADLGVGAVLVPPVGDGGTAAAAERDAVVAYLDATPGLERTTETPSGVIWRVATGALGTTSAWARHVPTDGGEPQPLASDGAMVRAELEGSRSGGLVVLAERADPGWRAWLDGRPLRAVDDGWRQAFEVPSGAEGDLVVRHVSPARQVWLWVQGTVLLMTVLLALPWRRRRGGSR